MKKLQNQTDTTQTDTTYYTPFIIHTSFFFPSLLSGSKAISKAAYATAVQSGEVAGHS